MNPIVWVLLLGPWETPTLFRDYTEGGMTPLRLIKAFCHFAVCSLISGACPTAHCFLKLEEKAPFAHAPIHLHSSKTSSYLQPWMDWFVNDFHLCRSSKGRLILLALMSPFKQVLQWLDWVISERKHPAPQLTMNLCPITGLRHFNPSTELWVSC